MDNKSLGRILIGMGAITLITTMVDYYALIFPTMFKSPHWVFGVTQGISDISVMPALAMVFLLSGLLLVRDKLNEGLINNVIKGTGIVSLLFSIGFASSAFMYAISAGGVENTMVESLKAKTTTAKEKINKFYEAHKDNIDEERYNDTLEKIDEQMMLGINQANSKIQKSTFKTMLNLGFFSLLNLYIFIRIFELVDLFKSKVLKLSKKTTSQ